MEVREICAYITLALLVCIIFVDCALLSRFRTYYRSHGHGVVTCVLLNLVATQLVASFLYTAAAVLFIAFNDGDKAFFFNSSGTSWIMSVTLVHVVVLTCLRIYSISYGNRFLKFVGSSFNIFLVVVKLWFVSLAITIVTVISGTVFTHIFFYTGVSVTGLFALIIFFCTTENHSMSNSHAMPNLPRNQNIDGVRNPQKTFVLFMGIIISFAMFIVPACITNLYLNFQISVFDKQISLIVSLWCLVGVLVNSVWIYYRLQCTVNQVTGFYSKWTLEEKNNNTSGDNLQYMDESTDGHLPERHSFLSDALEAQYTSIASLQEQIRKEIM